MNGCQFTCPIPTVDDLRTFPTDRVWVRVLSERGTTHEAGVMDSGLHFSSSFNSDVKCGAPTSPQLLLPISLPALPTGAHCQPSKSSSQTDCEPQRKERKEKLGSPREAGHHSGRLSPRLDQGI